MIFTWFTQNFFKIIRYYFFISQTTQISHIPVPLSPTFSFLFFFFTPPLSHTKNHNYTSRRLLLKLLFNIHKIRKHPFNDERTILQKYPRSHSSGFHNTSHRFYTFSPLSSNYRKYGPRFLPRHNREMALMKRTIRFFIYSLPRTHVFTD